MRTLRITFWASFAGWLTGILTSNVGGFLLTMEAYGLRRAWDALTVRDLLLSELLWALMLLVGTLPFSAFFVAPFVFYQKRSVSRWHPFLASGVGGVAGIIGLFLWLAVLMLFGQPINWSRPDERAAAVMISAVTFLIGATTGGLAAWLLRAYKQTGVPTPDPDPIPTPTPYDY